MFEVLKEMADRVSQLNEDMILHEALEQGLVQAQIIDLNRNQLYEQGIDAMGRPTGDYAPITINHYKPLARAEGRDGRTDHITLKDTGAFYSSMEVLNLPDAFVIKGDTDKGKIDLAVIYPDALGLTPESLNEIIPEIRDFTLEKVKEKIFAFA